MLPRQKLSRNQQSWVQRQFKQQFNWSNLGRYHIRECNASAESRPNRRSTPLYAEQYLVLYVTYMGQGPHRNTKTKSNVSFCIYWLVVYYLHHHGLGRIPTGGLSAKDPRVVFPYHDDHCTNDKNNKNTNCSCRRPMLLFPLYYTNK